MATSLGGPSAKRSRPSTTSKKRTVSYETYKKWLRDFDRELKTLSWLECETEFRQGKRVLTHLKCRVCGKFETKIKGRRNYSPRWVDGADSLRTSNIKDHAHSDQHCHAMSLLRKAAGESSSESCAPIVKALCTLPEGEKARLRYKFDIAYFLAKEKMSFRKYPRLLKLEAKHGVNLGISYATEVAGREFTHYIAENVRQHLYDSLSKVNFFSLLLDGSTDSGNSENELILVVWFDQHGSGEKVCTKSNYFQVCKPASVTAIGMLEVLQGALKSLGIQNIDAVACSKLVGFGTDGASANIAGAGLKGLVEKELPWIYWMWCMAHRLELAVKDAFKNTMFGIIDDMLLKLYYLYEKSPKKCRQLQDIINDLKECLIFTDNGRRPVRASGSRWISHKWNAMKRILSKYGAYTNHLASLSEDSSVKSADRAKMRGYYKKWIDGKYLLGCALFIDLFAPCAILSKLMQDDDLDILAALTGLLKSVKDFEKLKATPLDQWPTFSSTLSKCIEDSGTTSYQMQELKNFNTAKTFFKNHYTDYCEKLSRCTRERLAWSDTQVLRDIIFVLATQGWQKAVDEHNDLKAIDRLVDHFTTPLQAANAEVEAIHAEYDALVHYANQYISLSTLEYRTVWWRLFHAPDVSEWANALILVELLFSLPASNGKLERVFSQLNIVKSDRRVQLTTDTLNDLLTIATNNVSPEDFDPDPAIDLWWKDKVRRPNQKHRKPYRKRQGASSYQTPGSSSSEEDAPLLDTWDEWMASSSSELSSSASESEEDL